MLNWDNTGVTIELGELIKSGVNLWDFDYPVPRSVVEYNGKTCTVDFDKKTFEQKVIDHYYFRQIGQETPGRFLHYFRTRIQEIMPYYVQVYEFDAKFRNIDDPLESYNLTETFLQTTQGTGKMTGTNSSESTGSNSNNQRSETYGTSENLTKFSDTPQNSVDNLDNYLTTATRITGEETGSSSGTSSGSSESVSSGTSESNTEDTGSTEHTLTRKGNIGVQPLGGEVLNIRSAFINIDMQIIDELRDLFLQVY